MKIIILLFQSGKYDFYDPVKQTVKMLLIAENAYLSTNFIPVTPPGKLQAIKKAKDNI